MFVALAAALLTGLQLASGQNPDDTPDASPKLTTYKCTKAGGCASQDTSIVLEWDYHWLHSGDTTSCTTSSGIDPELCPDQVTCAKNCKVQGIANYTAHGVATSGNSMTLHQYTMGANGLQKSSPRVYLLGPDGNYVRLELLGQELTVEVDLSTLPCGQNGALYLGEMDMTGGRNPYNTGGAKYGSGYCDAQCPVGTWINGTLNTSKKGGCCPEMDILEANSRATAFTPHPCLGDSCDKAGCGFNPYAQGHHDYYGPGKTVDTNKPFTMTTAFVTTDGTTTGALSRITRTYRQGGRAVASAATGGDAIVAGNCTSGAAYGGLSEMGRALGRGMVLTFSIWNDAGGFMHWLDSGDAGPCSAAEGDPALIMKNHPDTHVVFSNIRWGDIGSTLTTSPGHSPAQPVSPSVASPW